MSHAALQAAIEAAWEARDRVTPATTGETREAVEATLEALDTGALRVAERQGDAWHVNQWAKQAVLLSFRLNEMQVHAGGPQALLHALQRRHQLLARGHPDLHERDRAGRR